MGHHAASAFSEYLEKCFISKTTRTNKNGNKNGIDVAILAGSIALANGIYATASEIGDTETSKEVDLTTTASINPGTVASDLEIQIDGNAGLNVDTLFISVIEEANQQLASLEGVAAEGTEIGDGHEPGPAKLFTNSVSTEIQRVSISDPSQPNPDIVVEHSFPEDSSAEKRDGDISVESSALSSASGDGGAEPQSDTSDPEDLIVDDHNSDLDGLFGDNDNDQDEDPVVTDETPDNDNEKDLGDLLTLDEDFFSDRPDSEELLIEVIGEEIEDGIVELGDTTNEDLFSEHDDLTLALQTQEQQSETQPETTPTEFDTFDNSIGGLDGDIPFEDDFGGLFG